MERMEVKRVPNKTRSGTVVVPMMETAWTMRDKMRWAAGLACWDTGMEVQILELPRKKFWQLTWYVVVITNTKTWNRMRVEPKSAVDVMRWLSGFTAGAQMATGESFGDRYEDTEGVGT